MYSEHVPIICAAMRADLKTFKRGVMLAVLSIRQPFHTVPQACKEVERRGGKARCLWGSKPAAYTYLKTDGETLWHDACAAQSAADCIAVMTRVPGLGIVKGAFVAQMLGHDIACIDSRNANRLGMASDAWNAHGRKANERFRQMIHDYVAAYGGRAQEFWDTWCTEIAGIYHTMGDAYDVSRLHLTCIVPKALRSLPVEQSVTLAETF